MMQVKDILLFTTKTYAEIDEICGFPIGFLQNRRYKEMRELKAFVLYQLSEFFNIDMKDLMTITKNDIDNYRSQKYHIKSLINHN